MCLLSSSGALGKMETSSFLTRTGVLQTEPSGLDLDFLNKRGYGSGSYCPFCLYPPNTGCGDAACHPTLRSWQGGFSRPYFMQEVVCVCVCVNTRESTARARSDLG